MAGVSDMPVDAIAVPVSQFSVVASIVLIAVVKVRFVIWHFMEVRHGPSWLRWICDAWLVTLALIVLGLIRFGE